MINITGAHSSLFNSSSYSLNPLRRFSRRASSYLERRIESSFESSQIGSLRITVPMVTGHRDFVTHLQLDFFGPRGYMLLHHLLIPSFLTTIVVNVIKRSVPMSCVIVQVIHYLIGHSAYLQKLMELVNNKSRFAFLKRAYARGQVQIEST